MTQVDHFSFSYPCKQDRVRPKSIANRQDVREIWRIRSRSKGSSAFLQTWQGIQDHFHPDGFVITCTSQSNVELSLRFCDSWLQCLATCVITSLLFITVSPPHHHYFPSVRKEECDGDNNHENIYSGKLQWTEIHLVRRRNIFLVNYQAMDF